MSYIKTNNWKQIALFITGATLCLIQAVESVPNHSRQVGIQSDKVKAAIPSTPIIQFKSASSGASITLKKSNIFNNEEQRTRKEKFLDVEAAKMALNQAKIVCAQGGIIEGRNALRKIVVDYPHSQQSLDARVLLVRSYLLDKDINGLVEECRQTVLNVPDTGCAEQIISITLKFCGEIELSSATKAVLDKVTQACPKTRAASAAAYEYGVMFERQGHVDEAIRLYWDAIQNAPESNSSDNAVASICNLLLCQGLEGKAMIEMQRVLSSYPITSPVSMRASFYLGVIALRTGRVQDAETIFIRNLHQKLRQNLKCEVEYRLAAIYYDKAEISRGTDDYASQIKWLGLAYEHDSNSGSGGPIDRARRRNALACLAQISVKQRHYDDALGYFNRFEQDGYVDTPEDRDAIRYQRAVIYGNKRQYVKAIETLQCLLTDTNNELARADAMSLVIKLEQMIYGN